MYKFPIKLWLISGVSLEGIALDTQLNGDKQECIKIQMADEEILVVMDTIVTMEALIDNPHFKLVQLNE